MADPRALDRRPPSVLYLCGWGRSGTTVLCRVLGGVEGFASLGELRSLWDADPARHRCGCGEVVAACPFWTAVLGRALGGAGADELAAVRRARDGAARLRHLATGRHRRPTRYADVLASVYEAAAAVSGARVLVDSSKHPADAALLAASGEVDLRVLHLVRDPRAVAHSWSAVPDPAADPGDRPPAFGVAAGTVRWDAFNVAAELGLRRALGPRYRRLGYEAVMARPRDAVADVVAWAGGHFEGPPFAPGSPREVRLGAAHAVAGNPVRRHRGPLVLVEDRRWVAAMAPGRRREATALALPLLVRYRYPLRAPVPVVAATDAVAARRPAASPGARALRHPGRALRHADRLWSPRVAYLDLHRDTRRAVLVVGSARSGTTLVAEALARGTAMRLVFEPLRRDAVRASRGVPRGVFVPPDAEDPALEYLLRRILSGRLRALWSDNHNTCRLPRGRIVKEVRATNLLPWLVRRLPEVPVVYVLRHPIAVAWSASALGMGLELSDLLLQPALLDTWPGGAALTAGRARALAAEGALEGHVARWCLENRVPTALLRRDQVHVVLYETLLADPAAELARLGDFLARRRPEHWAGWSPDPGVLARPSRTSWRQRPGEPPSAEARITEWVGAVPPATAARALAALAGFGLDGLYGAAPLPLVRPDQVLAPA